MEAKDYEPKYPVPDYIKDTGADYQHTVAHQVAYDFSIYLHLKMRRLPKYEKFSLQQEIRHTADDLLDELEIYEVTKSASHLYSADRLKRRLMRKIRTAHDLKYSAINTDAMKYCAIQISIIGKCIGGLIEMEKEKRQKRQV